MMWTVIEDVLCILIGGAEMQGSAPRSSPLLWLEMNFGTIRLAGCAVF